MVWENVMNSIILLLDRTPAPPHAPLNTRASEHPQKQQEKNEAVKDVTGENTAGVIAYSFSLQPINRLNRRISSPLLDAN